MTQMNKLENQMTIHLHNKLTLDELAKLSGDRLLSIFSQYLQPIPSHELKESMQSMLLNGGKRLRSLMIYAAGLTFNAPLENLDIPASAVEIIHTYSLIHDDLPCMDDADIRRGKPSCHKVYGEGMAVLAGDALHTLAMQIMANHPSPLAAERRIQMITSLSKACGPFGMAAGQALDITMMNQASINKELLLTIYQLKTGALFTACVELGRLASSNDSERDRAALKTFGDHIGLAFQIQDDLLDIEGTTDSIGKPQGLDQENEKITYPHFFGISKAKEKVATLYQEAIDAIEYLGEKAQLLRDLSDHMLARRK